MSIHARVVRILLVVLIPLLASTAQATNHLGSENMRDFIVSVYQSMPNDIKENEVRTLRSVVWELHHARMTIPHSIEQWSYTSSPEFRRAFFSAYGTLLEGLRKIDAESTTFWNRNPNLNLLEDEEKLDLMVRAYEDNAETFRKFLHELSEFSHFYPNLRIPEEQLLRKQIQFSGIVLVENPEVWEFIASLWSILVPYSQYSGK